MFKRKNDETSIKYAKLYLRFAYEGIDPRIAKENQIYDEYTFILDGLDRYRYVLTDNEYDYAVLALQKRMDLIKRR